MKKFLIVGAVLAAIAAAVWIFMSRKTGKSPLSILNTGTAKAPADYTTLWGYATQQSLQNVNSTISGVFGSLQSLSSNFGVSDNGNSPAAISGSNNGGIFTNGSGAATPVDSARSIISDSWFDSNFDGSSTNPLYA